MYFTVHEQDIVPWINEKDVKLCPGCAKSFNLLRRKHHCRLCGSIMCNECTFLLQLDTARMYIPYTDLTVSLWFWLLCSEISIEEKLLSM